jgi:hypothetical protein
MDNASADLRSLLDRLKVSGVMFLSEPGEGPSGWWDTLNSPGVAQCGMSSAIVERRGHIRCSSCTMGGI